MKGLIHIYEGDGKGKTTAAVGLSVRFAGAGGKVLFTQFLKDDKSAELAVLEQIPNIRVRKSGKSFGFTFRMTPEEKQEAAAHYQRHLKQVLELAAQQKPGLLVLDEILAAVNFGMVRLPDLIHFLQTKPRHMEVVLTGRNPAQELVALADYVTCMEKRKHPYDQGIGARKGIEL